MVTVESLNEVVFSKSVLINLKESTNALTRKLELNVHVEVNRGLSGREIVIRISDTDDPFFLFISTINRDEYERIKSAQGLLIDFEEFPSKFVELLQTCYHQQDANDPKFFLSLTLTQHNDRTSNLSVFEVIEVNPLKNLTHLSLRIPAASDSFIRSTLKNAFRTLKNDKERLEVILRDVQMQLTEHQKQRNQELERIKNEYEVLLNENDSRWKAELEHEKRFNRELIAKETEANNIIEGLQRKLTTNEEMTRKERNLRKNKEEKNVYELRLKISELEEQIKYKDEQLRHMQEAVLLEQNEKIKITEKCHLKQDLLDEREADIDQVKQDLQKANEIIRKLQSEVQSSHSKLNILNKVTNKQEEIVDAKEERVKRLESDLIKYSEQVKVKDKEYGALRKELEALKMKFEESQSKVRTNENVIAYLNKQLSDLQTKHGIKPMIQAGDCNQKFWPIDANRVLGPTDARIVSTVKTIPSVTQIVPSSTQTFPVNQQTKTTLPKVNLVNKKDPFKTDPKLIAQRNSLFTGGNHKISLF